MPSTHLSTIHTPSTDYGEPYRNSNVDVLVDEQPNPKYTRLSLRLNPPTKSAERDILAASSAAPNGVTAIRGSARELIVPEQQPRVSKLERRNSTSLPSSTTYSSKYSKESRIKPLSSSSSPPARPQFNRALSTPVGSYFAPQPGSSGLEARSPATRRAPASRSSHGIETSSGPPPALSTQRSYSTDAAKKSQPPTDVTSAREDQVRPGLVAHKNYCTKVNGKPTSRPHTSAGSTLEIAEQKATTSGRSRTSTWSNGTAMATSVDRYMEEFSDGARDRTLRALEGSREARYARTEYNDDDAIVGLDEQASNEDLFLNLARATSTLDAPALSTSRSERRSVSASNLTSTTLYPKPLRFIVNLQHRQPYDP